VDERRPGFEAQVALRESWASAWRHYEEAKTAGHSADSAPPGGEARKDLHFSYAVRIRSPEEPAELEVDGTDDAGEMQFQWTFAAKPLAARERVLVMSFDPDKHLWRTADKTGSGALAMPGDKTGGLEYPQQPDEEDLGSLCRLMEHWYTTQAALLRSCAMRESAAARSSGRGLFEHLHEDALKLLAARESGLPVHVLDIRSQTPRVIFSLNDAREPWNPEQPTVFVGFGDQPPGALWPVTGMADQYWRLIPFRAMSRRSLVEAEPHDVVFVLAAMAAEGQKRAIVKDGRRKRGIWEIRLGRRSTPASIRRNLPDDLFQALVEPRNGEPFLVQQFINMSHEYRVFVVDGRPVAGAPVLRSDCIHDPWLRGRFRPTVTPDRDAGPAVEDRSCVAAYARLARRFAHLMRETNPGTKDYVLDLATNAHGDAIVIELNHPGISGLYAVDWHRVLRAALDAAERRLAIKEETEPGTMAA
jgi:hypothetical protein